MVGYVLGPFIFAACMFGMVMQVSGGRGWGFSQHGTVET